MLFGHVGAALAAKRAAPEVSYPVLLVAADGLDLLCFALVSAGVERIQARPGPASDASSYPWSHGLAGAATWSAAAGAVAARRYRSRRTGAVLGLLVFSHWVLDFIAHAPDLPLFLEGSPKVGLGLEYSQDGSLHWRRGLAVELAMLGAGIAIGPARPRGGQR
ncbi:MAG: hypothetical protein ACM32E_16215 [Gemmatimonadota bacterium]